MADTLRVLYVDDDPALLEIGKVFLEHTGDFSVETIGSAPTALKFLECEKVDAIISDYQMPGMDGIQFLMEIRGKFGSIPFILFTGKGREDVVIQAINNGANFYLQKGGDPDAQFAELSHKVQIAIEHHRAEEKIQALDRLYSVLSATNKAIFNIRTKNEFFYEICRILVEIGGFRMAWIGLAEPEHKIIRPVAHTGSVDGYLDTINISTEDIPNGRGPTGTAYREGKFYFSNDITSDPRMEPWRENALKRGYLANAAIPFALGTKNAGVLSIYAPVTGFFDRQIIDLLNNLAGDITFSLQILDDQNDRKQVEEKLKESEEKFRNIFAAENDAVLLVDAETGSILETNNAACRMFGYSPEEFALLRNTDLSAELDKTYRAMKEFHKWIPLRYQKKKDGTIFPVEISISWFVLKDRCVHIAAIHDITERKREEEERTRKSEELSAAYEQIAATEEELRQNLDEISKTQANLVKSEERFRSAMNHLPGTAWAVDRDLRYTLSQGAGLSLIGLKPDQVIGMTLYEFFGTNTPAHPAISSHLRALNGEEIVYDYTHEDVSFRTYLSPLHDIQGNIVGVTGLAFDITEQKHAEEALRESEERLRSTIASIDDMIFTLDENGIFIDSYHPVMANLYAMPDQFIGKSFRDVLPEDLGLQIQKAIDNVKISGITQQVEYCLPLHGKHVWFNAKISARYSAKGIFSGITCVARDITERKRAKKAFLESESRYRLLADNATDVIWTLDLTGSCTYVSPSIVHLRGYTVEEVMQQSLNEVICEGSLGIVQETMGRTLKEAKSGIIPAPTVIEVEQRCKDGSSVWTEIVSRLLVDVTGNPTEFIGVSRNITERKRSEKALKESEAKFRDFFNSTADAIAIHDLNGQFLELNDEICRGLEFSREELLKMSPLDIDDPEYGKLVPSRIQELQRTGHIVFETVHRTKSGKRIPVEVSSRMITYIGNPVIISTARDITERKRAEEALRKANRQLNLLGNVTRHDITNKITVILGYLSVARKKFTDPELRDFIEKIGSATKEIQFQIAFTKVFQDLGCQEPAWQKLDTVLPSSHVPEIITLTADVTGVEIYADPMVEKVFFNLLDNSVRHGEHVTEIRVTSIQSDDDLKILWEDNGIGITTNEKKEIFKRGFGKNTGLGLFLSREILSITGITIHETGEVGKGAQFEMTVPKGMYR